jgi:hypothetical protein
VRIRLLEVVDGALHHQVAELLDRRLAEHEARQRRPVIGINDLLQSLRDPTGEKVGRGGGDHSTHGRLEPPF